MTRKKNAASYQMIEDKLLSRKAQKSINNSNSFRRNPRFRQQTNQLVDKVLILLEMILGTNECFIIK